MLKMSELQRFCPASVGFIDGLNRAVEYADLSAPLRVCHFMAQCAHESGGFRRLVENLNYSAEGLAAVWPNRYAVDPKAERKRPNEAALRLARKPEAIANNCYADRLGNGHESSGDGWRYRGRGLIQLTGKQTYQAASRAIYGDDRLLQTPDMLAQPEGACLSAAWFWRQHGINAAADANDVHRVTRIVNGGLNGINDRVEWLARAKEAFL